MASAERTVVEAVVAVEVMMRPKVDVPVRDVRDEVDVDVDVGGASDDDGGDGGVVVAGVLLFLHLFQFLCPLQHQYLQICEVYQASHEVPPTT